MAGAGRIRDTEHRPQATAVKHLIAGCAIAWLAAAAGCAPSEAADSMPAPAIATPSAANTPAATKLTSRQSAANPAWKDLSPMQQQALMPLANEWDKLDAPHKSKWVEIGRKFPKMSTEEKERIQDRMRAWVALTPDQRRVARESYARTKKLNTDQKSAQWEQYQQLPEEQKEKLAAEAARKNKVATLPPTQSKPKTVPPIKSVQKPLLLQSLTPASANGPVAAPPPTPATIAPSIAPAAPPASDK